MTFYDVLFSHLCAAQPWDVQRWTYRQMLARADFCRNWLRQRGVAEHDCEPVVWFDDEGW